MEEEMKQEVKNISKLIIPDNSIRFFKKKEESTKPSPSVCHIEHYKVAAEREDLTHLHTYMINIGLMNVV